MRVFNNVCVDALAKQTYVGVPMGETGEAQWRLLYFLVWPPPETVSSHFARLQENLLLGLRT